MPPCVVHLDGPTEVRKGVHGKGVRGIGLTLNLISTVVPLESLTPLSHDIWGHRWDPTAGMYWKDV